MIMPTQLTIKSISTIQLVVTNNGKTWRAWVLKKYLLHHSVGGGLAVVA